MEFLKGLNQAIAYGISKDDYLDIWKKEMDLKLKTMEASKQNMELSLVTEQMQKFSEQQQKIEEQQQDMLKQQQEILTKVRQIQTTSSDYNHPTFENLKENIESEVSKLLESLSRLLETGHNHHVEDLEKIKGQMITEICSELKEAMITTFNIGEMETSVTLEVRNIVCEENNLMRDNIISALRKDLDQLGCDVVYDICDTVKEDFKKRFQSIKQQLANQQSQALTQICSEITRQIETSFRKTYSGSGLTNGPKSMGKRGGEITKPNALADKNMSVSSEKTGQTDFFFKKTFSKSLSNLAPNPVLGLADKGDGQFKPTDTCDKITLTTVGSACKEPPMKFPQSTCGNKKGKGEDKSSTQDQPQGEKQNTQVVSHVEKINPKDDKKPSGKCLSDGFSNTQNTLSATQCLGHSKSSLESIVTDVSHFDWKILSISDAWEKRSMTCYNLDLSPKDYEFELRAEFKKYQLVFGLVILKNACLQWPVKVKVKISLMKDNDMHGKPVQAIHSSEGKQVIFHKPLPKENATTFLFIHYFMKDVVDFYKQEDALRVNVSIQVK